MTEKVLKVRYTGDASGLNKTQKQVESNHSKIAAGLKSMFKEASAGAAAFGVIAIHAYDDQEKALTTLQNTLAHNPALAKTSVDSWVAMATAISQHTAASRVSVEQGIATLGMFKLNADQMQTAIPLVVDYARKTGRDVPSAAGLVGKALLGNTRALKAIGIQYKSTGDPAKDFANITDLLRSKVGGFATEEGATASGRLDILKNNFTNMAATVGAKVVPMLIFLLNHLKSLGPVLLGVGAAFQLGFSWMGLIVAVTVALVALIIANWSKIKDWLGKTWLGIQLVATKVWLGIQDAIGGVLALVLTGIKIWISIVLGIFGALIHAAAAAFGWIPGIGPKIKAASKSFDDWKASVVGSLDAQIAKFNAWGDQVQNQMSIVELAAYKAGKAIGSIRTPSGSFGKFQHGTMAAPSGWAWVGEVGPELMRFRGGEQVLPASRSRQIAGGGGGGGIQIHQTVNVGGHVVTEHDLGRMVRTELLNILRRNGTTGIAA